MTSALYAVGSTEPVPQYEGEAQPGLEPVRTDGPAEADSPPDWNELDTDTAPTGHGLNTKSAGAYTVPTEDYRPWWAAIVAPIARGIEAMNIAQPQKGTAAAREEAGEQGHGTMQWEDSIDPVIRPGAAFGNDYFTVTPKAIQEGSGQQMTPIDNDSWAHAVSQARGVTGEFAAQRSTLYRNFHSAQ